jgi:hypothetical protein
MNKLILVILIVLAVFGFWRVCRADNSWVGEDYFEVVFSCKSYLSSEDCKFYENYFRFLSPKSQEEVLGYKLIFAPESYGHSPTVVYEDRVHYSLCCSDWQSVSLSQVNKRVNKELEEALTRYRLFKKNFNNNITFSDYQQEILENKVLKGHKEK